MSKNKDNVPKIRFPGFADAWEQSRLGDVVKIVGGATPSKANKAYWDGDIVWLSSQEIKDRYVSAGTYTITEKAVRESATKVVPAFTPLIVSRSGILARMFPITLPTVDVAINQDIKALFFDKEILDTDFFVSQLEAKENTILTSIVKTGTTVQSVNMPDFEKLIISIPSIQEQQKIGKIFKNLGNLITLHQRKLTNVKNLKAGLLQKMFPKDGEDFPEVRFPGFTDAWEQRELGEVTEVYDGTHQTPDYKDEGIMFLSVENIKTLQSDKYISEEAFENEFKVRPEKGDVLMTRIGDVGTANVVTSNEPIAYYVSLALLKKKVLNPYFLQASIHSFAVQDEIWKRTLHIAFPKKINKNEIAKVPINFPSEQEQDKIGLFFRELDNLITLHQRNLEHLQQQKKSLLQQMFVKGGQ
ncbi:restriction endonuclease subunit S [Paenibacillus cineris]|uniref:restriction endonuclease subunit S n=1 Tax=Paenibacillus cineris TaxID=237530 RepID=UPI001B21F6CA|nr:restriction endonuclease subunit S [Paenibacillus cineris]GIO64049.1 type I restriction endonuclease [Paenibacillus cineris]